MAVNANTNTRYDVTTIREDLQDAYISISPTECPFQAAIGRKSVSNTYFEWPTVDLAAPTANRVLEGEAAPGNDAPTNAVRLANYTQISDKVVEVSDTNEAVNGAADVQTLAKQVAFKLKELKRDMETMLVSNVAAVAGNTTTARVTAGLPAFLRTNVSRGATGASGTLSGTTAGFPNAAATDGTPRALTEDMLKSVIASCWNNGAEPSVVLCGSAVKQKISSTFTGSATKYQDMTDSKKLVAAVDIYVSDFGTLQIVPSRFLETRTVAARDVFVLDPNYARMAFLQNVKQRPLARTGHAERRMISVEYGLQVDTEKAHGIIADINGAL
jgi:Family of unknown function (DUF5309)